MIYFDFIKVDVE